ncbi:MAG: peptidoglycan-binding protein LysM [Saprospiraceae bacterium]|nr:peptidoglycan-binding protein LysM [Saprospiraceae bacterium]
MGLFSFVKNVGASVFNKEKESKATRPAGPGPEDIARFREGQLKNAALSLGIPIAHFAISLQDDKVTAFGEVEKQDQKEKIILALGNVEGICEVDDRISVSNPEPEAKFYEVKSGDTLSKISKEFYGDPMKYNKIFEANQPLLSDPDKIYPGQKLRIPPE